MGRLVLIVRLVLADLRRHPAQAAMLVLAVTAATATLALGLSLSGASQRLYDQTRAATAGPDVVALVPGSGPDVTSAMATLAEDPEVVAGNGPYRIVYATLTVRGLSSNVVVHAAAETPGPVDRPLVTSGHWVRPGGAVVERGFATALGVGPGDHVTIAGRSYPVVGIAVTAATSIYPWAAQIGPGGGPSDATGLVWFTPSDTRTLAAGNALPVTTALDLKLRDPDATEAFLDTHHLPGVRITFHTWQFKAGQDMVILNDSQPILVVGSWLLGFLAITGVTALAAGRAAEQTRRAGLLKAVGATPGLIAAVLLTEYLALALLADALGLALADLTVPAIASPTASRIGDAAGLTGATVIATTVFAVLVAALSTVRPTLRALRTATVTALTATAHRPRHRPWLVALSAMLPTPLLLGLRLTARRPGRAVLQACSTATTLIAIIALLTFYAQPSRAYGLSLPNLSTEHDRWLLLAVTALVIALAIVNTITFTWTSAMEARANMAIARTLGATPGQISAGLSTAQLLPVLSGALAGVPLGIGVYGILSAGKVIAPPFSWMLGAVLAILLATAALTALPARLAARREVARTLSAETA
ncbi:putative ABC transport system permease protein [Nonomuraea solani]|uniref:Putative ABC transport system permease protein n=1 Tax=Nonomuraea solani TaxID=1144553 RepID=A0A1H5WG14_9ACTN|nr:FtsX-like permease family protein [Nonomuraea solani]SEF98559.1 putative ABC transport system permease protein [Nonomuraea solani]